MAAPWRWICRRTKRNLVARMSEWGRPKPDQSAPPLLRLIDLGAGELDHLRPFRGFFGDEFTEFGRRHRHAADIGKALPVLQIGERGDAPDRRASIRILGEEAMVLHQTIN